VEECREVDRRAERREFATGRKIQRSAGARREKRANGGCPMNHVFENHDLVTDHESQLIDVTDEVRGVVERADVTNGMALVYSPHTTCAIVINERESGFLDDFADLLAELAPSEGRYYRHDDLTIRRDGLDDDDLHPNGWSHLRSGMLASSSQTIPILDGQLMLGRWQRIFFCELDRSRPRKVFIQVAGE
jgi:secondary thiamine-phosphate synthase enzyme